MVPLEVLFPLFALIFVFPGLCLCYGIWADANARGAGGTTWAILTLLLLPVAVPAYLVYRRRLPSRGSPPDRTERYVGSVGIGGVAAMVAAVRFTPPDPFTTAIGLVGFFVVLAPAAFVLCYGPGRRVLSRSPG